MIRHKKCLQLDMSDNSEKLKAIVDSISEYCHVLGQPSTLILSSVEILKMPNMPEETRQLACDTCYEAALEIKNILTEMKRKCDYAEETSES